MSDELAADPVLVLAERFAARASEELSERLSAWKTDLSREEEHAVLGALLARQVTLASELALSPSFWNGHVAPLLLRAMADVYITRKHSEDKTLATFLCRKQHYFIFTV